MIATAARAVLRRGTEQYTMNVRFCNMCNHVNKVVPSPPVHTSDSLPIPSQKWRRSLSKRKSEYFLFTDRRAIGRVASMKITEEGRQASLRPTN